MSIFNFKTKNSQTILFLVVMLLSILIIFLKWSLIFFLTLPYIFTTFVKFSQLLGLRQRNPFIYLFTGFLLIWAIYIAVSPYSWYWILLHGAIALAPFYILNTLLKLSPKLYVYCLQSDVFDIYIWEKQWIWKKINWVNIVNILNRKKYRESIKGLVRYCLSRPTEKGFIANLPLQRQAFDNWIHWPEALEDDYSSFSIKQAPIHILGMENFIAFVQHPGLLEDWLNQGTKKPAHFALLHYFFERFNNLLSEYIADPQNLWYETPEPEQLELRIDSLLSQFAENPENEELRIQMETSRGLSILALGLAIQMKCLPESADEQY